MPVGRVSASALFDRIAGRHAPRLKRELCLALARVGLLRPFTFVQWLATYGCNFNCAFCEATAGTAHPDELDTAEVKAVLDDLTRLGVRRFVVSGGEPLMRRDVPELMAYAHRRGLAVGLVSNGALVAQRWAELAPVPLYLYFTSIDGTPAHHDGVRRAGSHATALDGLRRYAEAGVRTRMVNTVVTSANLDMLPEILNVVRESGATSWHVTPVASVGRATSDGRFALSGAELRRVVAFVRESRRSCRGLDVDLCEAHGYLACVDGRPVGKPFFCGAGLTRCSIMPDGTVLGCHQVYDTRFAEGNVRERPFSRIWREGFQRFRDRRVPAACGGCPHLAECHGGCWAEMELHSACLRDSWNEAGDVTGPVDAGTPRA